MGKVYSESRIQVIASMIAFGDGFSAKKEPEIFLMTQASQINVALTLEKNAVVN